MRFSLRLALASLLAVILLAGCSASAPDAIDTASTRLSNEGLYRVTYTPETDSVPLNTLHAWTIHVESAEGEAVSGADLSVTGGMPAHNHGMPTQPQMTADLGGGDYRIEGMKFQMPGHWTVSVAVAAAGGSDTVTFDLMLQ